jgi:ubiquinone/menaquinone biosynthesis C-methylase UbiE
MDCLKNYERVAVIYPYMMRTIRYDKWANYLYRLVKLYIGENDTILELGAGNGMLAEQFRNYFPFIIISDISFEMLRQSAGKDIKKVCCDMTAIPFKKKFDLIYSTFDTVNYLSSKKKLLSLFNEIKRVLSEKGIFTFDVSLEPNSLKHIKEPFRKGKYDEISFVQKSSYNPKSRIHKNIFLMEFRDEIYTETHKQKIYPFAVYFELLEKAGLNVTECYEAFTFKDGNAGCERVQFVVRN